MSAQIITLTTDFGSASAYTAILKGALLTRCPGANLVDLGHDFAPGDTFGPAFQLLRSCFYYPAGTVHLVGLDPAAESEFSRVLLASAAGQRFLAMDNGVLGLALEREPAAEVWTAPFEPRTTFAARDALVPLAALLFQGVQAQRLGSPAPDWQRLGLPRTRPTPDGILGEVLCADRFGNLITNVVAADAPRSLAIAGTSVARWVRAYAELAPNQVGLLWGAEGWLEISAGGASAAELLGARRGTKVQVYLAE
ncbi:MAG TPA: SAM-dependent chlorinase/fluorinase [Terriglobales bacterium]|nr:SAM-dependent chlorinase/fluorinase [Terriglobales bacterium]